MLTVRGAVLLTAAGLLWLVGRLLGVDELHVAGVAAAALVALAWLAVRLPGDRIAVRRLPGVSHLAFGAEADVRVDVRNDSRWATPGLMVEDAVPESLAASSSRFVVDGLKRGRTVRLQYRIRGTQRGRFALGPARLRLSDPFDVARRTRRTQRVDELVVYPRIEVLPEVGAAQLPQGRSDGDQHRVLNLGDEFHTMREYVQGDDLRRVHWPSTARQQKLMVRQHEMPWRAETTILLDTRGGVHTGAGDASTFEATVSAAASSASHFAHRQHLLRLTTESDRHPPQVVSRQDLLDRLAVVGPSSVPNLGGVAERLRAGGGHGLLLACVVPPPGADPVVTAPDTRALLRAGRGFSNRIAVVVHSPGADERAGELVSLLRTAGWRSVALSAGSALAEVWPALVTRGATTPAR